MTMHANDDDDDMQTETSGGVWEAGHCYLVFKEIYIIQELCRNNGAKVKLFGLNSWTWIPKEMNKEFFDFNYIQVAKTTVEDWFLQQKDINVGNHTVDGEHFNEMIHKMIATEYLPSQF